MAVNLSPIGGVAGQFFDNNGNPLVGGKLYTYAAGTTTPQVTFTSASGDTPNSNPIILNAGGRVPAEIWLTDGLAYKFVLYTSADALIGSWDNIVGINSNFVNFVTSEEVQTATAGQTVFTLTAMQYQPGLNNLVVYVDGVNQVEGGTYSFVETSSTTVTFTAGLHLGAIVKFVSAETLTTVGSNANVIAYEPAGVGAVTTTVQTKLRETVSVKDFGAVGDGVTDDTAAINAAIEYVGTNGGGAVYIPNGTYGISRVFIKYSNVTLYGNGAGSVLQQIGSPPANFAANPNGTSIFTNPSAAITIAPPAFQWGNSQNPDTSSVGTVSSIYLQNFKLIGWFTSAPPPYTGYNTNLTGQTYNDRALGIMALCSAEIYYDGLIIAQMGGENSYSWNAKISKCWIVGGGEVGSLGQLGHIDNCRVQSAYGQNGVGARRITNNVIFAMPNSGIYFGGSSQVAGIVISNNYVFDCDGYALVGTDDGAFTVSKQYVVISDNAIIGKTGMSQNAVAYIDFRAAGSSAQISNNFITAPDSINGLFFGPCQGNYTVNNNTITGTGVGTVNGIDLNGLGSSAFVSISENTITGFTNLISPLTNNAKVSKGINYLGGATVENGSDTLQAQTIDNLIVKQNVIHQVISDVAATTLTPVANVAICQYQYTSNSLTVNPPTGYQPGQTFIIELLNASGGNGTVTFLAGVAPAAYKGSMTSGQTVNGSERVIIQMVYITNTWLEVSKSVV